MRFSPQLRPFRGGVQILDLETTPVRKRPKSVIWLTLTARVRGNRKPRTGFGSFAREQKNIFAKLNFLHKSTLETFGLTFDLCPKN